MDKQAMYELMNQQLEGLLKATPYRISGLANASALCGKLLRILTGQVFISWKKETDSWSVPRKSCLYRDWDRAWSLRDSSGKR